MCFQIPHAKETDKATLLTLLGNHAPGNFRPIQFGYKGEMAVFYLDDRDVANLMRGVSRRITLPGSNFKVCVLVILLYCRRVSLTVGEGLGD